jgi:hypothetical protein
VPSKPTLGLVCSCAAAEIAIPLGSSTAPASLTRAP